MAESRFQSESNNPTLHMMPRYILPQPVSQRQLQTIRSQPYTNLDVGTSAVHRPFKRSFSQFGCESDQEVDTFKGRLLGVEDGLMLAILPRRRECDRPQAPCESDKEVDRFKGRLLGVEDGLIDAIVSESCNGHSNSQGALESASNFLWYSQMETGMPERKMLPSAKRPGDALALPTDQCPQAFAGSETFHATVSFPSNPYPCLNNHKRCSIVDGYTAAHHTYHPSAVDSRFDSIASNNGESFEQFPNRVWKPIDYDLATAVYSTPSTSSVLVPSPSTSDPDLLEVTDTPRELDEVVVDSKMLERSEDSPSIGTWDLSSWQTLEFTISDLLVVRE